MSVELQTSKSIESPIDAESLEKLLVTNLEKLSEPSLFIQAVASALHEKSTKHKFIVLVTEVHADKEINEDLSLKLSVGTVWDTNRDGYHLFKVVLSAVFMVTVFWVYSG